jgi:hypothetical protein
MPSKNTMVDKVRWGVLSTANIALTKVLPAMQRSPWRLHFLIAAKRIIGHISFDISHLSFFSEAEH